MLKKARETVGEMRLILGITMRFMRAMSHGWAHDLVDRAKERAGFDPVHRPDFTTTEAKLLKLAKSRDLAIARQAVAQIEKDSNLLALYDDESVDRFIRLAAVRRLRHQGTLIAIGLGRDIEFAQIALDGVKDQMGIALILKHSLFTTIRGKAASLCDDENALLAAEATDPDEDVRWHAAMRFAELNRHVGFVAQA